VRGFGFLVGSIFGLGRGRALRGRRGNHKLVLDHAFPLICIDIVNFNLFFFSVLAIFAHALFFVVIRGESRVRT
jgi:hypothetical protein